MTRAELIKQFRYEAQDEATPYLFPDASVSRWLTEAEAEAAIRARLIHESANPAVCEIAVTAGTSAYPLHAALYEIDHIALVDGSETRRPLRLVSREWLDDNRRDWRDLSGAPEFAVQSDNTLRVVPRPTSDATLRLEGYRLPLEPLGSPATEKPEINPAHHRHLVCWLLYRAYSTPDAEVFDPQRAEQSRRLFASHFGESVDSDLRRGARHDEPQHNTAWF